MNQFFKREIVTGKKNTNYGENDNLQLVTVTW